ncbi:hypothetical protein COJ95_09415 [Bacillus cereus]|nr:hypothetical protein COJ95_09415 [Bacillus cereus]
MKLHLNSDGKHVEWGACQQLSTINFLRFSLNLEVGVLLPANSGINILLKGATNVVGGSFFSIWII